MAMKGYATFHLATEQESHYQVQFRVICKTLIRVMSYPLGWDAVNEYFSLIQFWYKIQELSLLSLNQNIILSNLIHSFNFFRFHIL